jgi:DNA-binding transcriptional LysR family regulator
MPDFEAGVIAKVAERVLFSAAAQEFGLAKTTLSKVTIWLEKRIRTALLHRTKRSPILAEILTAASEG